MSSATLGCVGVLHLVQALAATDGLAVDGIWLVTRAAQPIENRAGTLQVAQSPLWGLGRVASQRIPEPALPAGRSGDLLAARRSRPWPMN